MKSFFFSLLFVSFSIGAFAQGLAPGSKLPKAVFYKENGTTFSTDQIPGGKKSLIMFFDATCEHCQKVAGNLSKNTKELSNVNFYMISQDVFRSINYFVDTFAKPLKTMKNVTTLQDKDYVFIPLFHPKQYPSLYLYGPDKKLILFSSNEKDLPKFLSLMK
ncbi:redoxin domain-containing protein [Pedobacter sp. N36a]|uniref:TlpA family protein disulfide reductase n=1 Tax=Pedobacter sp. N36a TaxID=2767996 RepID=UPI0016571A86|nr:redoxin domain-containing protein [Pedobacter sp. N36a]MBC8984228.1 redoxin domain-containing protein [Pedobacter sp. N36a]